MKSILVNLRRENSLDFDPDLEVGLEAELYSGRKRHSTERRQIGFTADWRDEMPKVGKKRFPYTKAGKKAAAKAIRAKLKKAR